jgi:hypothetical protein
MIRPTDMPRSTLTSPDVRSVLATRDRAGRIGGREGRLVVAVLLLAGCTDPLGNDPNVPDIEPDGTVLNLESAASCPPAAPSACAQTPSYAKEIAPLVERSCLPCHSPGGIAADRDLTNYSLFVRLETTDFVQVSNCLMPPPDAGPDATLTLGDRTELLQWFVCGSPNN